MWTGYLTSDFYYQRPILDPILLWCHTVLCNLSRMCYVATGKSIYTLARWESTQWWLAARCMRIRTKLYVELPTIPEQEKQYYMTSVGGRKIMLTMTHLDHTSSVDMMKHEFEQKLERLRDLGGV